ncbi:S8 family serine peptidase [Hassallia byssoidea VB512170]|uniref:S8 family serine peptidase n=1 Tax=Hassallia byssoidea VB512170 TaxID=1304833 RepID=A0A846HJH4_9CYAN|nr:S8 family serine peptidase [Hassalia byssoidea]NEU76999.1 S8 family serine peptidase [Hassalia byssoidea VB512170]
MPVDYAGNSLDKARKLDISSNAQSFTDRVDNLDLNDFYSFNLSSGSSFHLKLDKLKADADVALIRDANNNGQFDQGEVLSASTQSGKQAESINEILGAGSYYIRVYPDGNAKTNYKLTVWATPFDDAISTIVSTSADLAINSTSVNTEVSVGSAIASASPTNNTNIVTGSLRADTFNFQSGFNRTIYFGNGNVDYGSGARDLLNLSQFASTSVTTNYADNLKGGVVYNAGKGNSLYDAITFSDGSQILFQGIESIQFKDKTVNLSVTPNDPLFNQQWDLQITDVHNAWNITQGNDKVAIGIVDTGLAANSNGIHPDLQPTSTVADNYFDESATYSHGTEVEGTIAAASNNGVGIAGINWISPVEIIDVIGDNPGDYDLVKATQTLIDWAGGKKLVINYSLSGGSSPAFEKLVADNKDKVLFVIASGNQDLNTIASPASLAQTNNNVLAIGSSWGTQDSYGNAKTPGDRITYKDWWGSRYGDGLTLMAPSEFIATSATRADASANYEFGYYDRFNGTSASAAVVTGIASLVLSTNLNLTAGQVKTILSETAYDLGAAGYDTVYGYGLVNADAAVRRAEALDRGFA